MKLKNRITLLTAVWVIGILLFVDLLVYALFIRTATQNEIELLETKARQIIEYAGIEPLFNQNRQYVLYSLLPENTAMRVVNRNGEIANVIQREPYFYLPPHAYRERSESVLTKDGVAYVLLVRVPIYAAGEPAGTLEMIERMETLGANLHILVTILFVSTCGAVVLSIAGGVLISRTIMNPITRSTRIMEEIERSLAFKRIPSDGQAKDELHQLTETFNRMMDRLEESFLRQQQFVSDASHELNTTLTIIEGYANMLRRWGASDEHIRAESIQHIYEETERMRKMTQQLLVLAAAQQDTGFAAASVDVFAASKQAAQLMKQLHARAITVRGSGDDPVVEADPDKIKQLLLILLDNALKYSEAPVDVFVRAEPEHVEIRVKDAGIGIPKDQIELVFERFYRVDQARLRKTGGTGLGLPIAQAIVKEHRGTIEIASEEGAGTEVCVRLPRTPSQGRDPDGSRT